MQSMVKINYGVSNMYARVFVDVYCDRFCLSHFGSSLESDDPVISKGFDQVPARYHGESGLVCDFERLFGRRCKLWVICIRRCKLWVIVSREGYSRLGGACQGRSPDGLPSQFDFYTLVVCISTVLCNWANVRAWL